MENKNELHKRAEISGTPQSSVYHPSSDDIPQLQAGSLPLHSDPSAALRIRHTAAPHLTALQSNEILIVEDSPVEAEILRRSLVRAGYRVRMAKNGEEGLQLARQQLPAIVISDINMPVMNGYQLCHAIKYDEVLWNIPVILLTVLSEPEDIMQAINSGADSYIIKPFDEATLLERVRALLSVPILIRRKTERRSEIVEYNAQHYRITGGSQQILNLLLSVFENTLAQNRDLIRIHVQLNLLNENLDEQVRQRTTELLLEKQKLEQVNRTLRILSACNVALVQCKTEDELFERICRLIVELGCYQLAWVSYPGEQQNSIPIAHFGNENLYRVHVNIELDQAQPWHRLTLAALRTGQIQMCNNLNEIAEGKFDALRKMGVKAIIALPLIFNAEYGVHPQGVVRAAPEAEATTVTLLSAEQSNAIQLNSHAASSTPHSAIVFAVLSILSADAAAFDGVESQLLEELTADLAFGINSLRTISERDRAVTGELFAAGRLRRVLEETITAVALTLEKRDPYAAGHQQRVARLASNIAAEMGLAPQQVEGIHFGALLHNIGTIAIPAEILNRPGQLTNLQFALVKRHSRTSFDIIKDISFPWPVAKMVLQHHERMNGSGYPQGLVGEQIMLEARVLAVADVVEAMLAYRPYRDALDVGQTLEILVQGRDSLFDTAVVSACLNVFRKQGGDS